MIKNTTVTFRVTTEQKEQLEKIANEDDRKVSYLMQKLVEQFLDSQKEVL
ncbi:hypothetical protein ACWTV9_10255 [Clostridioides difficile]